MRTYQHWIRIHFRVCLDLYFWLEQNLMMSFRNEDMPLWKQKIWAQKCRTVVLCSKLVFSSFSALFIKPNRQIIVWIQFVNLWMFAAEGTFDFDLELKKRSSLVTILDKNSYTFNWIPITAHIACYKPVLCNSFM